MSAWAGKKRGARDSSLGLGTSSGRVSVDRRLSLLVLSELLTALLIVVAATVALGRLAEERDYMDRYVFAPLHDIGEAQAAGTELSSLLLREGRRAELATLARPPILRLQAFIERYQRDWETGISSLPDASRLRDELARQGESHLLEHEHAAVGDAVRALRELRATSGVDGRAPAEPPVGAGAVVTLGEALVQLNAINLRYVQIGYRAFERARRAVTTLFIVVGLTGILAAGLLGLWVRQAVAPRVRRMVDAVKRFRKHGALEPIEDDGDDDLAVLAHTLSLCFRTINGRDKDRERFLAVAAHELKTPLTTLKGFAQLALAHPGDNAVRERALAVIDRQSTRLARLAQDLLWSARAGAGKLPFHPAPVDLEALAQRVIGEVRLVCPDHDFRLQSCPDPHLFGDENLLEQSVWNLLVQAAAVASDSTPVRIDIAASAARLRFTVEARGVAELPEDLDDLVQPFVALPFEGKHGAVRGSGLGLHLVDEIARLHGGTFRMERRSGDAIVSCLEFRR
jgi:signal transduction histidine kinase